MLHASHTTDTNLSCVAANVQTVFALKPLLLQESHSWVPAPTPVTIVHVIVAIAIPGSLLFECRRLQQEIVEWVWFSLEWTKGKSFEVYV